MMASFMQTLIRANSFVRLVPFFKCVCLYFVVTLGESAGGAEAVTIAAKCAPILCLFCYVMLNWADKDNTKEARAYSGRVAWGLALSGVGDALLVGRGGLLGGMAAFGAAHVAYVAAFGLRADYLPLGAVLGVSTLVYCSQLTPPPALRPLVPAYGALLAGMAWRGLAWGLARRLRGAGACAAAGPLLFVASDAVLAYGMFNGPVPHGQVLVMSTYYLGQLGIALSTTEWDRKTRTHTDSQTQTHAHSN